MNLASSRKPSSCSWTSEVLWQVFNNERTFQASVMHTGSTQQEPLKVSEFQNKDARHGIFRESYLRFEPGNDQSCYCGITGSKPNHTFSFLRLGLSAHELQFAPGAAYYAFVCVRHPAHAGVVREDMAAHEPVCTSKPPPGALQTAPATPKMHANKWRKNIFRV